ncbi:MAG: mechanosensitive ion channel family protein, partial [Candidatus Promineifilaceae bacterium]
WASNTQGSLLWRILGAAALLLAGIWLVKFFSRRAETLLARAHFDDTLHIFLSRLISYSLYALLIIIILSILGIPMTSLIAIIGAAALAIGLALQDSLQNIASSILIIILKPYVVGDFVEINDRTGRVYEVGLYHTRIRTPDNKILYIPNSQAMSENIINYSRLEITRVDMVFGIGYEDDLRQAKQILIEILKDDERILDDPEPIVAVKELADNSVNFAVQPYVNLDNGIAVRYSITEQVKLRFDEAGISIPYPQRDIHVFNAASLGNEAS